MQNQNSGGWRYGNGSNDFLYKNEGIDNELLKRAAAMTEAPKGLLDQAVQVNPLDKLMQQSNESGGGSGNGSMGGEASTSTGKASDAWGANQYGYNVGYSPMAGMKGFATMGPLGALAGLQVSKDELGKFAYNALVAQENRDTANSLGSGLSGFGMTGGTNEATTSGGDFGGGYDGGGFGTGNEGAGFSDGSISGGSFGDGGYGGGFGDGGGFGSDSDSGGYGGDGSGAGSWYKGGPVSAKQLVGPDPKTPDDGYGALQDGEYVIKASSVKKYGKGLLADINSGKYKA